MGINTAHKGALFENKLLNIAIKKGATLAMRGASSKSRSRDKNLKIDIMFIKDGILYLIQAKNHKKKASPWEKGAFYSAIEDNELDDAGLLTKAAFIESIDQFNELLEDVFP